MWGALVRSERSLRGSRLLRKRLCFPDLQILIGIEVAEQFYHLRHQAGPAGLMACSQTSAIISVEILVEQDVILPVRIGLKFLRSPVNRSTASLVAEEYSGQP